MHIRRADATDTKAAFSVLRSCFSEGQSEFWSLQSVSDLLSLETTRTYLAVIVAGTGAGRDQRPVGCIFSRGAAGEAEILNLAVLPSFRRRGVATALLDELIDDAHTEGIDKWSLEVRADNVAARALYNAAGFAVAGMRKAYYRDLDGNKKDAVIMSRLP